MTNQKSLLRTNSPFFYIQFAKEFSRKWSPKFQNIYPDVNHFITFPCYNAHKRCVQLFSTLSFPIYHGKSKNLINFAQHYSLTFVGF